MGESETKHENTIAIKMEPIMQERITRCCAVCGAGTNSIADYLCDDCKEAIRKLGREQDKAVAARKEAKRCVNVMGVEYRVEFRKQEDDEFLKEKSGYCDFFEKLIVIELQESGWESEEAENNFYKHILRHELVHATLYESGLSYDSENKWAINEEIVDWIASQGRKLNQIWNQGDLVLAIIKAEENANGQ